LGEGYSQLDKVGLAQKEKQGLKKKRFES